MNGTDFCFMSNKRRQNEARRHRNRQTNRQNAHHHERYSISLEELGWIRSGCIVYARQWHLVLCFRVGCSKGAQMTSTTKPIITQEKGVLCTVVYYDKEWLFFCNQTTIIIDECRDGMLAYDGVSPYPMLTSAQMKET